MGNSLVIGRWKSKLSEFDDLLLTETKISGTLTLDGDVKNILNMDSLNVGINLFLSPHKIIENDIENKVYNSKPPIIKISSFSMIGAKIGGVCEIENTMINKEFCFDSTEISGDFLIRNSHFGNIRMQITYSVIKKSFILNSSIINILDLSGTVIGNYLDLGHTEKLEWQAPPTWTNDDEWDSDYPRLILLNTQTQSIQDTKNSWPKNVLLDGFRYSYFGSYGETEKDRFVDRDLIWFKKWLGENYEKCSHLEHLYPNIKCKQWKYKYSAQPYVQLSRVLRETGFEYKANEVLYSAKNRLKEQTDNTFNKFYLRLQCYLVGYGFRYWYTLIWVFLFIIIGMILFLNIEFPQSSIAYDYSWKDALFFSVDRLVPVLELSDEYNSISIDGCTKYYFYIQKIMGYILAVFLTAALTGITKRLDE